MNPVQMNSDPVFVIKNLVAGGLEVDIVTVPDLPADLPDPPTVIVEGVDFLVHVEQGGLDFRRLRTDFGGGDRLRQRPGEVVLHQRLVLDYVPLAAG